MQTSSFTFGQNGVHAWLPDTAPRAVLRIIHGMGEHGSRYARAAAAFVDQGFAVYAHDHRGHGDSPKAKTEPGHLGDVDGFNLMVSDAHDLALETARRHPGIKSVTFAHSMGAFVCQALLLKYAGDAQGFILCGSDGPPNLLAKVGRLVAREERLRLGKRKPSPVLQMLSFDPFNKPFKPNRTAFDWLSRDPTEVDKYIADPQCGVPITTQSWVDLLDALDTFLYDPALLAKIPSALPVFLVAGDRDPVGHQGKGMQALHAAYLRAGLKNLSLKLYPGARHELLNETNRDEVTADLLEFAKRVVA